MRLITTLVLFTSLTLVHGQGREKILNTDSGRVVLHYFNTGKVSTKEWIDKDDRWGRSWAYDSKGKEIFSYPTRKIGGHASAHFSYHPNGAVSKVEVSDAPDGGIQWYRSTTTFDENGVQTGFTEQGHDNDGIIPGPGARVTVPPVTEPFKQEEVKEQQMFVNEVFAVNSTKWACALNVEVAHQSPALHSGLFTLQPGDTLRIGTYSMGEVFDNPKQHVTLTAQRPNTKGRKRGSLDVNLLTQQQMGKEHIRYYFFVRPTVKPWYGMKWLTW